MTPDKNPPSSHRGIVVIGGSGRSLETLSSIAGGLPADFPGSIFIVIHIAEESPGLFGEYLEQCGSLPATYPRDHETIRRGHIYVARAGYQMTLEPGKIRVQRGPRENRHRPAIDPLFRTAARVYGARAIGIVLSGLHDDGSAGLYAIRQRGGIAIVQDPRDAALGEMPRRAIEYSTPDYILPASQIAPNLIRLVRADRTETVMPNKTSHPKKSRSASRTSGSIKSDKPDRNITASYSDEGEGKPSVFACPECHGVLWELKNGYLTRFRCRVGHSYSADSLSHELSDSSERALWAAMRALEEKAAMQRRIADRFKGNKTMAGRLRDQSAADDINARVIRDMIFRRDAELEVEELEPHKRVEPESRKRAEPELRKRA